MYKVKFILGEVLNSIIGEYPDELLVISGIKEDLKICDISLYPLDDIVEFDYIIIKCPLEYTFPPDVIIGNEIITLVKSDINLEFISYGTYYDMLKRERELKLKNLLDER